jgi:hypothetical protein
MNTKYPAIADQIRLLQICQEENFQNKALEDNRKLLEDLENLQVIIFDRRQRYGNPNYREMPVENELRDVSMELRTVIASQMLEEKYDEAELESLIADFRFICRLDSMSPLNEIWRRRTKNGKAEKAKDRLARMMFDRCKRGPSQKKLPEKEREKFINCLKGTQSWYNTGSPLHKSIDKILAPYEINQE